MSFSATERRMRESTFSSYHPLRSAPRVVGKTLRIALWKIRESCAGRVQGRGSRRVRRYLTALLLLALPAAAEEIRIELSRGKAAASVDAPGARLMQGGRPIELPGSRHTLLARAGALLVDG